MRPPPPRPAGAEPGEIACGLVVERQLRLLRAKVLRSGTVEFSEIMPTTNPKRWKLAPPAAVAQAERALRDQTGCMVGSGTEPISSAAYYCLAEQFRWNSSPRPGGPAINQGTAGPPD
jgi:hypothetical protein